MSKRGPDRKTFPAGTRACLWCGTVKTFRAGVKYCGQVCVGYGRALTVGDQRLQAIAVHASAAAAEKRRADVAVKVEGMDAITAFRYGYKLGQAAGYQSAAYRARRDARRIA